MIQNGGKEENKNKRYKIMLSEPAQIRVHATL